MWIHVGTLFGSKIFSGKLQGSKSGLGGVKIGLGPEKNACYVSRRGIATP